MPLTIEVKGIKAYGRHGVYNQEKKEEQLFLVDVKAILKDTKKATDKLRMDRMKREGTYVDPTVNTNLDRTTSLLTRSGGSNSLQARQARQARQQKAKDNYNKRRFSKTRTV